MSAVKESSWERVSQLSRERREVEFFFKPLHFVCINELLVKNSLLLLRLRCMYFSPSLFSSIFKFMRISKYSDPSSHVSKHDRLGFGILFEWVEPTLSGLVLIFNDRFDTRYSCISNKRVADFILPARLICLNLSFINS